MDKSTLTLILEPYAWLTLWLLGCWAQGLAAWGLVFRREPNDAPPWPNPELAVFMTVCTGMAVNILALIVLAMSHLLSPLPVFAAFILLTLASVLYLRGQGSTLAQFRSAWRGGWKEWAMILPVFLLILAYVIRPLGPAWGMDALTYHLPYARFYLEQGGLVANELLRLPYHTHNLNLLYSVALIHPGASLAQMVHAVMGFAAMLGVYGLVRYWYGWISAVIAASAMLLLAEFIRSFEHAYADNGVMLFAAAAFIALAWWLERRDTRILWFCALFAGTAMGTKYFGSLMTIPLGLAVLWYSRDIRLTLRFALLTALFGLFWYLRSWWLTGNPVHPFAGEIFGHYLWSARELAANMEQLGKWGLDKTVGNFFLLPYKLFTEARSFNGDPGNFGVVIGAFYLSFLFIHRQKAAVRVLQITCLAYLLFWFTTSQVIRYLMLILPLMSVAVVCVFSQVVSDFVPAKWKNGTRVGTVALVLVLAVVLAFAVRNVSRDLHKIPLHAEQQAEFLSRRLPAYDLAIAAEEDPRIGKGPLIQFRVPESKYFFTGTVVGDWMGQYSYQKYGHIGEAGYWMIDRPEDLHAKVKAAGIKAVAMHKNPHDVFKPYPVEDYREYFEIVLETDRGVLMIPK